mmetsp:Transcript_38229/g.88708  ORF Transcript_38229/g.88708 Transcript_38229/m.88708 type:complete len:258 (-) Transcript_38229:243-1016(-)
MGKFRSRLCVARGLLGCLGRLLHERGTGALLCGRLLLWLAATFWRGGLRVCRSVRTVFSTLAPLLWCLTSFALRCSGTFRFGLSLGCGALALIVLLLLLVCRRTLRPLFVLHGTPLLHDLFISVVELLEVLLVTTLVGVTLHGHKAVSSLDLRVGSIGGDTQDGVCRVLVEACDFIDDLAFEAHLPEDVLIQSSVHLLQLLLRKLLSFLLCLLCRQLQLPHERQVIEHKAIEQVSRGFQRPGFTCKRAHELHSNLQL